ncbi:cation:proton antiporter regulatory subunit [Arthrobacter mobilis]|uniref:Cation:proton antiporter regulatory subunit n=1 Tax=Arthrobacter mobilis TaxID=2724944 RepID=A0A7X6K512_9MICC|nr:cation:proton antiporter regulatory subunit [Arthrobacter mobilis]NKX55225.1 cation:proton antiporter regulatory subunit [Arthrobacter mobilis]
MDVQETPLPGIGIRREIVLGNGRRVGLVIQRDGQTELIISKVDDPDACLASIPLSIEEAATLGSLLGGPQLVAQLAEEHSNLPGVSTRQFLVTDGTPFAGRPLGDTRMRTRTGASVVAMLREGQVLPSPSPNDVIEPGDLLVVVGTPDGLDAAAAILHGS